MFAQFANEECQLFTKQITFGILEQQLPNTDLTSGFDQIQQNKSIDKPFA